MIILYSYVGVSLIVLIIKIVMEIGDIKYGTPFDFKMFMWECFLWVICWPLMGPFAVLALIVAPAWEEYWHNKKDKKKVNKNVR